MPDLNPVVSPTLRQDALGPGSMGQRSGTNYANPHYADKEIYKFINLLFIVLLDYLYGCILTKFMTQ